MVRYALVVGINEYQDPIPQLTKPSASAEAFADILDENGRCQQVERLIGRVTSKCLTDAIKKLFSYQSEGQEVLFYYSGHAAQVFDNFDEASAMFVPSDCSVQMNSLKKIVTHKRGISFESLNKQIAKSKVSRLVAILDCCHGGALIKRATLKDVFTVFDARSADYLLISGCQEYELARAKKSAEYSVFSEALMSGLAIDKADSKGKIRGEGLVAHISGLLEGKSQEVIYIGGGRPVTIVEYARSGEGLAYKVKKECPYQGLNAFEKGQQEFFFGRENLVHRIRRNIDLQPFVSIIGASGSGKSSVVRAGLLSWLEAENLKSDIPKWQMLGIGRDAEPIKPGVNPLSELIEVFKPFYRSKKDTKYLYAAIENGTSRLSDLSQKVPGAARLVLVVDQFEEIFTVCPTDSQRQRFIELITQVGSEPDSRLVVIMTMRADFLEPCLNYSALHKLIQSQTIFMPPLTPENVREIIEKPANMQGHTVESSLTSQLLSDMAKQPGALPLLEFALTQLWEQRDKENHCLTLRAYQSLGAATLKASKGRKNVGLVRALNQHSEKVYCYSDFWEDLPVESRESEEQAWIKQIFLRLVRVGKGEKDTRQRQSKKTLLALAGSDVEEKEALLELLEGETGLVQGRLLVTGKVDDQDELSWVDLSRSG